MKPTSAIVIGAGIGGITAAAHLARHGIHATVLEKNLRPGGRFDRFSYQGHHFDAGPTLYIMPLVYQAEFATLGASVNEMLALQRVNPTYNLVFDDGAQLALTADLKTMCAQLEDLERGSFEGFLRYMQEGARHYQLAMERLVLKDFRSPGQFFNLAALPLLFSLKPLVHHYNNMSHYFRSPRLKAAFTFQDVYMGLSPFQAPATFSMMPYTEMAHGAWYPKGGMYQVVQALMQVAARVGVEYEFGAEVDRIEIAEGRARGVRLKDGRRLEADVIVANADLPYVYHDLLPDEDLARRLYHKRYSCSTISFFWGVDEMYTTLGPHTLFLADDYRENFQSIVNDLTIPDNPSVYVHAPARLEAAIAPQGEDTLIGIVPVGHLDEDGRQDWQAIRDHAREAIFRRLALLGIDDLQEHIKFEICYVPLSWRKRFNLMKGATHGLCHTLTQLGYFRPHNRHPRYPNLYFVGSSTHPGTGVPTALVSARLAVTRIMDDLGL
ncbi:MAG: phytoene desaturase family protein [Chloroflexi bacterium]|nr:phytoene desaturase family protein [Chloroflexota bacterium]